LTVQPFRLAPEAAVSGRIGSVDCLGNHAFKAELAGLLEDKLAVAGLMAGSARRKSWRLRRWVRLAIAVSDLLKASAIESNSGAGASAYERRAVRGSYGLILICSP
jgi:hypothetical protein